MRYALPRCPSHCGSTRADLTEMNNPLLAAYRYTSNNWALIQGSSLDPALPNAGLGFTPNFHTGSGGNTRLMKLVIEGMKLQPVNPSFLQARDAILQADLTLNGGQNIETIWRVSAPTLQLSTASKSQPLTFRWTNVSGAQTYSLWVSRILESGAETVALNVTELRENSFTPTAPLSPGTYRVWLRAIGTGGFASSWSEPVDISI